MKNTLNRLRWIAGQARPFIFTLAISVIAGALASLTGIFMALLSKQLIDSAATAQMQQVVKYMLLTLILILADVGIRAFGTIISARNSARITNSIQIKLYARLTRARWNEFSKYHSGDFLTRLTSDVDAITTFLTGTLSSIIALCVMLFGSFIALLLIEPSVAVLAFVLGPVSLLISRFYGRRLKKLYIKIQESEAGFRSLLQESIQNIAILKAFCLEKNSIRQVTKLQTEKFNWVVKRSNLGVTSNSILSLSSWLGYLLIFGWGAMHLSKGVSTFGTFTALLQLVGNIQGPFSGLARTLPQVISAMASSERLMTLDDLALDANISPISQVGSSSIHFENVSFGYDKDTPILMNVNFTINPGETIALIGPSGEGKTTLVRLLLSFINPQTGYIYITNRHDKFIANASTRQLISYVPQGNTLFSGTIADNLRYGNPDASDQELEAAARAACAWEFIENFHEGINTRIGEHGLGISEGQAQRLAIARALLRKAPILIFDEATSSLDINTELKILQTIHGLGITRTCIIITHRLTALKICDRIFKLENGHLVEPSSQVTVDQAIEAV